MSSNYSTNETLTVCPLNINPVFNFVNLVVYITILVLAVCGNSLVILVTCKTRRARTAVNYFIVNMAAADLVFTIFVVSRRVVEQYTSSRRWFLSGLLGSGSCKLAYFIQDTCTAVSIFTLVAIAVERHYAVVHPMRSSLITAKVRRCTVFFIWVISCVSSAPYFYAFKLVYINNQSYCVFEWENSSNNAQTKKTYFVVVSCFTVVLPLLTLSFIYSRIICTLRKRNVPGNDINNSHIMAYRERRNRKVMRLVVAILFAFIICWVPLFVVTYFLHLDWKTPTCPQYLLVTIVLILAYTNAAVNPFLYFIFSQNIRKGACLVLKCGFRANRRTASSPDSSKRSTFIKARTLVMSLRMDSVMREKDAMEQHGPAVILKKFDNTGMEFEEHTNSSQTTQL